MFWFFYLFRLNSKRKPHGWRSYLNLLVERHLRGAHFLHSSVETWAPWNFWSLCSCSTARCSCGINPRTCRLLKSYTLESTNLRNKLNVWCGCHLFGAFTSTVSRDRREMCQSWTNYFNEITQQGNVLRLWTRAANGTVFQWTLVVTVFVKHGRLFWRLEPLVASTQWNWCR